MAKATVWYKTRLYSLPKYKDPIPAYGKTIDSCWKNICCRFLLFAQTKQPLVIFPFQLQPLAPENPAVIWCHKNSASAHFLHRHFQPKRLKIGYKHVEIQFSSGGQASSSPGTSGTACFHSCPPPCPTGLHSAWSSRDQASVGWALLNDNHNTSEGTAWHEHSSPACAPD